MGIRSFGRLVLASAAALAAAPAFAAGISGLYNTGLDGNGDVRDDHWTLQVTAGTTAGYESPANPFVSMQTAGFPFGPWLANTDPASGGSRWLTPLQASGTSLDPSSPGTYVYSLTFDLTGFDVDSASFSGRWTSDNNAVARLNGTQFSSTGSTAYSSWAAFSVDSGFVAGLNTLEFIVTNLPVSSGNPTGFRAEFLESAVSPVPEPQELALLAMGLGLLGAFTARHRRGDGR